MRLKNSDYTKDKSIIPSELVPIKIVWDEREDYDSVIEGPRTQVVCTGKGKMLEGLLNPDIWYMVICKLAKVTGFGKTTGKGLPVKVGFKAAIYNESFAWLLPYPCPSIFLGGIWCTDAGFFPNLCHQGKNIVQIYSLVSISNAWSKCLELSKSTQFIKISGIWGHQETLVLMKDLQDTSKFLSINSLFIVQYNLQRKKKRRILGAGCRLISLN